MTLGALMVDEPVKVAGVTVGHVRLERRDQPFIGAEHEFVVHRCQARLAMKMARFR